MNSIYKQKVKRTQNIGKKKSGRKKIEFQSPEFWLAQEDTMNVNAIIERHYKNKNEFELDLDILKELI